MHTQAPPKATEGLQLNARPSKRQHQQQQQQQQQQQPQPATTDDATPLPSTPPQQQQQQQLTGGFQQTVLTGDTQAVKVSLNDCLACSGCVTSAETVLLQVCRHTEYRQSRRLTVQGNEGGVGSTGIAAAS
jgi:D-arabinose 1-dehydrogenase-like Zn-dependent alcohol dehydrogenase